MFIFAQIFYSMKMKKGFQAFEQDYKRVQMDLVHAAYYSQSLKKIKLVP